MWLEQVDCALRAELEHDSYRAVFAATKHRHPLLAAHRSPASLLKTLETSLLARAFTDATPLLRALLAASQAEREPVYQAIGICVFMPHLKRLRSTACLGGRNEPVDSIVLFAFLEAMARFPVAGEGRCVVRNLCRAADRRFHRELHAIAPPHEHLVELSMVRLHAPPPSPKPQAMATAVRGLLASHFTAEDIELLIEGQPEARSLRALASDCGNDERSYQRIKRRRARLFQRAVEIFSTSRVPIAVASCLYLVRGRQHAANQNDTYRFAS